MPAKSGITWRLAVDPVVSADAVKGVLAAVAAVLLAFGWWDPTPEQMAALLGVYTALVALLSKLTRDAVTPTADPRAADGTPLKPMVVTTRPVSGDAGQAGHTALLVLAIFAVVVLSILLLKWAGVLAEGITWR